MRAFLQAALLVSSDLDQVSKLLDLDETVDDSAATASTYSAQTVTLAASQANLSINFGGVTNASMVFVVASQEIALRIGASDAPLIPVRPTSAVSSGSVTLSSFQKFDQPGIVLWRGKISALWATNPSSSTAASFFIALVGEAS